MSNKKSEVKDQRSNEHRQKPTMFANEYGEPSYPASLIASVMMVLCSFIGLLVMIGLIWFSRCFAHFLKTGGWSWMM